MQVIDHEIERGVTHNDLAFSHQDQVGAATQFEDGDLWPLKYHAHADCPHELSGFVHAVCLQNDVRNT